MILERLLLALIAGAIIYFLIGKPLLKLIRICVYQVKDPLESAQTRLERARKEVAAAELDKQTSQVYENLYKEEEPSEEEPLNEEKGKTVEK